jgi:DNA adenine methylase
MQNILKAPMPYFGGKSKIAPLVWSRFGDVPNYVEPFAGSLAVLLARPTAPQIETVNDADALLSNFWRAMAADPEAVAHWADWPVNETDLHARHKWLRDRRATVETMMADPEAYDAKVAGWWVWGISQWIGSGWCLADVRQLPHISDAGTGDERPSPGAVPDVPRLSGAQGVHKKRPHLVSEKGVFARPSREHPSHQLPHVGDAGRGEHRAPSDLIPYFNALASRLRRVRVCCGEWDRVLGPSVTYRHGTTGVFLDPPYPQEGRADVYSHESDVFHKVRAWAIENGTNPLLKIAICGYDFEMPDGWERVNWKAHGGYGSQGEGRGRKNAKREVVWFSPACNAAQIDMFAVQDRPAREAEQARKQIEAGTFAGQEYMLECLDALVKRGGG